MNNEVNNATAKENTVTDTYLDVAQTAKLLRKELRTSFPGVRFSVRSNRYAGGSSVDVTFDDVNTDTHKVREVADRFQGVDFEGMTDSTVFRPATNGVRYGAHYVFVRNDAEVFAAV
jgi:hypothetical protein